jgi:hypothetical protein
MQPPSDRCRDQGQNALAYLDPALGIAVGRPPQTPRAIFRREHKHRAPDRQISCIRLSDKTSRLHPRHVVPKRGQADESEVPVQVREWISPALASSDLVLDAQGESVVACRPIKSHRCPLTTGLTVTAVIVSRLFECIPALPYGARLCAAYLPRAQAKTFS